MAILPFSNRSSPRQLTHIFAYPLPKLRELTLWIGSGETPFASLQKLPETLMGSTFEFAHVALYLPPVNLGTIDLIVEHLRITRNG